MKMSKGNEKQQLTAAQRLIGLEQSVATLDQALYNQTKQLSMMRDALSLLHEKVNAMILLMSLGHTVTDQAIDQVIEQKRIEDMKKKVEDLLAAGSLEKAEEVSKKSFLVVREMNSETGTVINPRLQFAVSILNQESIQKLIGKKVGDSVKFVEDNPAVIEIEEIYNVVLQGTEEEEVAEQNQEVATQEQSQESESVQAEQV
jgi:hypothetical protein